MLRSYKDEIKDTQTKIEMTRQKIEKAKKTHNESRTFLPIKLQKQLKLETDAHEK